MVARDAGSGPDALVLSGDSRLLAFVGPSKYVVTVMEACSLDEVPAGSLQCWGRKSPWITTSQIGQELGRALERASPVQQVLTHILTA